MGIKSRLSHHEKSGTDVRGFVLEKPGLMHFKNEGMFLDAVKEQAETTALVEAKHVKRIGLRGEVEGTDWRLSNAAFGDLCNFTKTPVSFIKRLAQIDEAVALQVMESMIREVLNRGQGKTLVIDSRCGRIEGIVGADSYSPIPNADVFAFAMTALDSPKFTNGWLEGPVMRMTVTKGDKPLQPKKGDVVHYGISVENSIHGDTSAKIMDYLERLVCTNGMVARDKEHMEFVRHTGDVAFGVQEAVVRAAFRAELLAPKLDQAANLFLDPIGVTKIRNFISDPRNGGNPALDVKVTKAAMREAQRENRQEEEVTLWNFVNGVTEAAHDTKSLSRKVEIEALGYRTLSKFGVELAV